MKVYDDPIVFPRPLLRTAFPPPLQCMCTWAYSPRIYGTVDEPYVLKIYYGMCPVRGHRTRASVGLAIDWELEERKRNERQKGQESKDRASAQTAPDSAQSKRRNQAIPAKAKRRHRKRQDIIPRAEYL